MRRIFIASLLIYTSSLHAQIHEELDGKFLLAETKQVGQFFRRFNGEEDFNGRRVTKSDTLYQNTKLREFYISNSFDELNLGISDSSKEAFMKQAVQKNPQLLDFRGGDWFAQVDAMFEYNGKIEQGILFLALEKENKGYKWVLTNVYFYPFAEMFTNVRDKWEGNDFGHIKKYIHPKSHELHFINLTSALNDAEVLEDYVENGHSPDFLTLFIFEMKRKKLALKSINKVNFHFFQVNNWYFRLSDFRRDSKNSGWLISDLAHISNDEKKILKQYIFMSGNTLIP